MRKEKKRKNLLNNGKIRGNLKNILKKNG